MPALARTAPGRRKLFRALQFKAWPLLYPLAYAYRRLALPKTRLVAVTGSLGKTTTTRAVAAALGDCYCSVRPNHFNHAGYLALRLLGIPPGRPQAAMEVGVSRRAGYMAQQARMLRPDVAVVTCIASELNTSFPTLEVTRREKAQLPRALPAQGLAVLNGDDPNVIWMAGQTAARVVTFGFAKGNQVRADDMRLDWPAGTRFTLKAFGQRRRARAKLMGRHSLYSVLAAVAVALMQGLDLDEVLGRLASLKPTPMRMQPVPLPNGAWLLRDDYKSTRETIDSCLDFFGQVPAHRRIIVIGNVTEYHGHQNSFYRELGERVARISSRVLFYGTTFAPFKVGLHRGGLNSEAITHCHQEIRRVIEVLRAEVSPGDVVMLKGRGNQRLGRAALALLGQDVKCDLENCFVTDYPCDLCPMLARGWGSKRKIT